MLMVSVRKQRPVPNHLNTLQLLPELPFPLHHNNLCQLQSQRLSRPPSKHQDCQHPPTQQVSLPDSFMD